MAIQNPLNLGNGGLGGPEFNPFFREGLPSYGRGSAVTPMQAQIQMISDALSQFGAIVQQRKMDALANASMDRGDVPGASAYVRRALPAGDTEDPGDPGPVPFASQDSPHTGGTDEMAMQMSIDKQRRDAARDALRDEILTQEAANMRSGRTRSGGTPAGTRSDSVATAKGLAADARLLNSNMPKDTDSPEHLAALAKQYKLDPAKMLAATDWKPSSDGTTMIGQVPKLDSEGNPVLKTPAPLAEGGGAPAGIGLATDGFTGTGSSELFGDSAEASQPTPQFETLKVPKTVFEELTARKAAIDSGTPYVREGKGQGLFRPMDQYLADMIKKPNVSAAAARLKAAGRMPSGSAPLSENHEDYQDAMPPGLDSDATPATADGAYLNSRPGRGRLELPQPSGGAPNGNAPQMPPAITTGAPPAPVVAGGPALAPAGPGGTPATTGGPPEVRTQADFDQLAPGTRYLNVRTGQMMVKPTRPPS